MEPVAAAATRAAPLEALLRDASALAGELGRDDLVDQLREVVARVQDPTMRVVVVGQFKQGKSALVNALIDAPVCPVDDVIGTAVPTIVRHGEQVTATLYTEYDGVEELQSRQIPADALRQHVTEAAAAADGARPVRVDVTVPRPLLADGVVLVDTPGVGGTTASHASSTLTMLPQADAVLMVSDASQEFTEPELVFLRQASALCPTVTCIVSKTDPHPFWRDIVAADAQHLAAADLSLPLVPVSAALHHQALALADSALDDESGIPDLVRRLRTEVVDRVTAQTGLAVAHQVLSVVDHLALALEAELHILRDPRQGEKVVRSLQEAEAAVKALGERSALWQQTLNDGISDLTSDVGYDLRDRMRTIGREVELLIDDCDPADAWDEIGGWLADSIAQAVGDNFVWAHQRSEYLARQVAEHFAIEGEVALPQFQLTDSASALNPIAGLSELDDAHLSTPQKFLIGMRGSYSGVLMFGVFTSLAGMALINPISIAAGMVIGSFAYRQEANQRLIRRRNQAKTSTRRLIDEAIFQIAKNERDRLNDVRRTLRDHFTAVAANMRRSLTEAIESAKSGAGAGGTDGRHQRITALETFETRLRDLAAQATALRESSAAVVGATTARTPDGAALGPAMGEAS